MLKFLLLLFFVCAVSFTVFAQKTWLGTSSTNWTEASNWLPAGIPSATDNIVIPTGTPNSPVVLAGASVSFRMIVIDTTTSLSVEAGASMTASGSTDRAMKIYGTLTNRGTITVTDVTSNVEISGAIEIYGVMNNYGTLNEIGAIKHGIMISGKLTNFPGGQISVENPYAFRIEGGGSFDNKSGAKLLARGTIASLGSDGTLVNSGIITCEGDAWNYGYAFNEYCATFIVTGSLTCSGNFPCCQVFVNFGLTSILGDLDLNGVFTNRGVLKYGNLPRNPLALDNAKPWEYPLRFSIVINPDLTLTRFGIPIYLDLSFFRDAEGVESAGTYDEVSGFHPSPSLPVGRQTLYMREYNIACTSWAPFIYVNVPGPGTWLGTTSSDWSLPANWSDEKVPGSTTNVNIPMGSPNYPVINALDATANDIMIAAGASITLADFASFQIKGNVTNSGSFDASASGSTVYFSGTNPQTIPGGKYHNLTTGGAKKTLSGDATVSTYLFFSGTTKIALGNNTLTLADGISVSGAGAGSYFITDGTGGLKKNNISIDGFIFPVGTESSYTPVVFSNYGTADNFTARVGEGAYPSYLDNVPQGSAVTSKTVNKTWYISEDVMGGSNAVVTLHWNSTDELPSFDRNLCFVSHYKTNHWDPTAASAAAGGDPYNKTRASITSFSPFAVANPDSPLPVTLSRFDAVREGNTALLSWSTASETNSNRFDVERSIDGKQWESIGSVGSAGDSKELVDYGFVDLHPYFQKENFYRLRMVDADGTFAYSRIRNLSFAGSISRVAYPNPATDKLFVPDFKQVSSAIITDMSGKIVYREGRMNEAAIHVTDLSTGLYMMEISWTNGLKTIQKIVINR